MWGLEQSACFTSQHVFWAMFSTQDVFIAIHLKHPTWSNMASPCFSFRAFIKIFLKLLRSMTHTVPSVDATTVAWGWGRKMNHQNAERLLVFANNLTLSPVSLNTLVNCVQESARGTKYNKASSPKQPPCARWLIVLGGGCWCPVASRVLGPAVSVRSNRPKNSTVTLVCWAKAWGTQHELHIQLLIVTTSHPTPCPLWSITGRRCILAFSTCSLLRIRHRDLEVSRGDHVEIVRLGGEARASNPSEDGLEVYEEEWAFWDGKGVLYKYLKLKSWSNPSIQTCF